MNYNQIDNNLKELIEAAYSEGNVLLEKKSGIRDCTYIFSSSNGLYFPNTASVFTREIVHNDRYEWLNIGKSINNNKSIFLRDVYKQWYSKGVNTSINSIEKIISFCKKTTANADELITVGTSSGGYLSVIIGLLLDAKSIYSFSGQFQLETTLSLDKENNAILREMSDNKFVHLDKILTNNINTNIYYFVSKGSVFDQDDLDIARKHSCIKIFLFKGEIHGVPFYSFVLKYLLNKDDKEMLSLFHFFENKTINPVKFAIKVCGLFHFIIEFALLLNKKILKFFLNRRGVNL